MKLLVEAITEIARRKCEVATRRPHLGDCTDAYSDSDFIKPSDFCPVCVATVALAAYCESPGLVHNDTIHAAVVDVIQDCDPDAPSNMATRILEEIDAHLGGLR